jgi:hypothetical protein
MMTLPNLTPDCSRCDALCCILLAFDQGPAFAFDKPACAPCRHLVGTRCGIHAGLAERGFAGCVSFDCHGAGQVVTALFQGRSWRTDPSLLPDLDAAFRIQRRLHEAMVLLQTATSLPLTEAQEAERQALLQSLSTPRDAALLQSDEPLNTLSQSAAFFASLRAVTPRR